MASWFHATILATGLAATVAVSLASAALFASRSVMATKSDRLTAAVLVDAKAYQTIETRSPGTSILTRVQLD